MTAISDQKISIASGGQTLCVDMLAGPAMRFTQTSAWTSAPSSGATQWHGKFYSTQLLGATEFIALMRVGCAATTASATQANGVWTVPVGDKTITISDSGISVATGGTTEPPPPPPPPPPSPPPTSGSQPYSGTPMAIPATLRAELFDRGGEAVAYHDGTSGNAGGQFRPAEDVDIIASPTAKIGPYVINNFQTGEWLAYTINVPSAGNYYIDVRASTTYSDSTFHIEIDGQNVTGTRERAAHRQLGLLQMGRQEARDARCRHARPEDLCRSGIFQSERDPAAVARDHGVTEITGVPDAIGVTCGS